jgi:hypothetical protein
LTVQAGSAEHVLDCKASCGGAGSVYGTLLVNGELTMTAQALTVRGGGKLRGTGSVVGSVTVVDYAAIAPGSAAAKGSLHVDGDVTLKNGMPATLWIRVGGFGDGQYDRLWSSSGWAYMSGGTGSAVLSLDVTDLIGKGGGTGTLTPVTMGNLVGAFGTLQVTPNAVPVGRWRCGSESTGERDEVVAKCDHLARLRHPRTLPLAFMEHGAISARVALLTARRSKPRCRSDDREARWPAHPPALDPCLTRLS